MDVGSQPLSPPTQLLLFLNFFSKMCVGGKVILKRIIRSKIIIKKIIQDSYQILNCLEL